MMRTCPVGTNKLWLMLLVPIIMAVMIVFMVGAGKLLAAETDPEDTYYFTFIYELQMSGRATRDCLKLQMALSIVTFLVSVLPAVAEIKKSQPLLMTWYVLSLMGVAFWGCGLIGMFFSPSDARDCAIFGGMFALFSATSLVTKFRYDEIASNEKDDFGSAMSVER